MVDEAPAFVVVDCETTGLDPVRHEVYEVAFTKVDDEGHIKGDLYFWIEPTQLHLAEPGALQVGRFYERAPEETEATDMYILGETARYDAAAKIAVFTEGCHLVGAKPDFDAGFLNAYLRDSGLCPAWHHRLIDIESLAIGLIVGENKTWGRPMSLSNICEALDIERNGHSARGDCEAARIAFFKLMQMAEERERAEQALADEARRARELGGM